MPAFLTSHSRNYSWPPAIFHIVDASSLGSVLSTKEQRKLVYDNTDDQLPDIDEDPFAHFISPVTDEDDPFDVLSLSAGILPVDNMSHVSKANKFRSTVAKKWARYMARNHPQLALAGQRHGDIHGMSGALPTIEEPEDEEDEQYVDSFGRPCKLDVREPTRGRAQDLLSPDRRQRGRQRSQTLSRHRHSWREPSPELFTVDEEEESTVATIETDDGTSNSRRSQRRNVVERAKL